MDITYTSGPVATLAKFPVVAVFAITTLSILLCCVVSFVFRPNGRENPSPAVQGGLTLESAARTLNAQYAIHIDGSRQWMWKRDSFEFRMGKHNVARFVPLEAPSRGAPLGPHT